ncbi:MAG TPA: metalloregulator ArsR/SmtB family transcription factor [Caulobacteraceae bacterium]|nr:metalloregulator ArsR/SmtB family transcription factor [Caulobacteraceae bacterium]
MSWPIPHGVYIHQMQDNSPPPHDEIARLENRAATAARMMKMLASEQRLVLLCRLLEGEASVNELAGHASLAQATASQHLAKLRADGLVATRRQAQTIYYRLADAAAVRLLNTLCDIYGGE